MKKLLSILVLSLLFNGSAFADALKPTNDWLKNQSVNSLTNKHSYVLVETTGVATGIIYTLKRHNNIVSCVTNFKGGKAKNLNCYLP